MAKTLKRNRLLRWFDPRIFFLKNRLDLYSFDTKYSRNMAEDYPQNEPHNVPKKAKLVRKFGRMAKPPHRCYPSVWKKVRKRCIQCHPICERCGVEISCECHHKDRNIRNNADDNLQALCSRCHHEIHRRSN